MVPDFFFDEAGQRLLDPGTHLSFEGSTLENRRGELLEARTQVQLLETLDRCDLDREAVALGRLDDHLSRDAGKDPTIGGWGPDAPRDDGEEVAPVGLEEATGTIAENDF